MKRKHRKEGKLLEKERQGVKLIQQKIDRKVIKRISNKYYIKKVRNYRMQGKLIEKQTKGLKLNQEKRIEKD